MNGENTYRNPLVRDGQSQSGRHLPALSPDYIKVDERDRDDLTAFARDYSKLIQYYDENNQRNGDWSAFFKEDTSPDEPHYALFLAFTWLFRLLQKDLNTITERHLNHYYKEILQLKHKPAKADTVHILLELAKNIEEHRLEKGTLLKAGKDALGKDLFYAIDKDIVLNKARVTDLKTIFKESLFDQNGQLKKIEDYGLYASPIARSADGLGADEDTENLSWKLLGESQEGDKNTMPKAEVGFAISSPILLLKEGTRNITLEILLTRSIRYDFLPYLLALTESQLNAEEVDALQQLLREEELTDTLKEEDTNAIALKKFADELKAHIEDQVTSEEKGGRQFLDPNFEKPTIKESRLRDWWTPINEALNIDPDEQGNPTPNPMAYVQIFNTLKLVMDFYLPTAMKDAFLVSLSGTEDWIGPYTITPDYGALNKLVLELNLTVEDPAVSSYLEETLEGGFGDCHALMKIMLNFGDNYQYSFLKNLNPQEFKIGVQVDGVKSLVLQNDTANINPNKTFHPFGPQPSLQTNFYIGNEEVFQKNLKQLKLKIDWADLPDDLQEHYKVFTNDMVDKRDEAIAEIDREIEEIDREIVRLSATIQDPDLQASWIKNPQKGKQDKIEFYKQEEALKADRSEAEERKENLTIKAGFFKSQFQFLSGGKWHDLKENPSNLPVRLFNEDAPGQRIIEFTRSESEQKNYKRPDRIQEVRAFDNQTLNGFIKMQLVAPSEGKFKAFGHQRFQKLYTEKIIEQMKPSQREMTIELPNEPYTPAISGISLDYQANVNIHVNLDRDPHEKLFHIHPFGIAEPTFEGTGEDELTVLPNYKDEGTLLIGLESLTPSRNMSILFQLNEKSVDHEFVGKVKVVWSYLRNNQWTLFDKTDILEDSTEVFTKSGIITFQMPKDISDQNSLLPKGKYWIRATVADNTLGVADARDINAQAITASFTDRENDPNHLASPLSAKAIKKLRVSNSAIKSITQSYPSFNGQLKEEDSTFYTRVSERLRHKRRGISIWDYEHLVLEAFPSVYKAKCLNHYNPEQTECKRQMSPGAVTLIVLSRAEDETDVSRKLAPVTNVITLNAIKDMLKEVTPPFIGARNKLFVKNPSYTKVKVECAVKFNEGLDEVYYQKELKTDLMRLFSPWAFDESKDISFERKLYKSLIVNYIEELPYVNFISCFEVYATSDNEDPQKVDKETIEASDPANILISDSDHSILIIEGDTWDCGSLRESARGPQVITSGIGAMVIEKDFEVAINTDQ